MTDTNKAASPREELDETALCKVFYEGYSGVEIDEGPETGGGFDSDFRTKAGIRALVRALSLPVQSVEAAPPAREPSADEREAVARSLVSAAQAVVDRWDTPLWKEAEPTAHVVNRLRSLLAALARLPVPAAGQGVEPVEVMEIQERYMDGIDAGRRVHDWINGIAEMDAGKVVSREKRVLSFTEDDGGAVIYMRDNRVAAAGMIVRDLHNFSIAMRMFELLAAAPTPDSQGNAS